MADLNSLIKLHRHRVEEKQKILAGLYQQAAVIEARKADKEAEIAAERKILEDNPDMETGAYFGSYAEAMRADMARLDEELARLETRIGIARDDLRAVFAELKKVEIVQRNRQAQEEKERLAGAAAELDEIGIEGYRRQKQDGDQA